MITVSLVLFMVGSILCAVAPNMPVLIVARGLQGLGGGGIMPVVQTVISDVVSPRERGRYQAYFSGVWMAAGLMGPVLGGVFAVHLPLYYEVVYHLTASEAGLALIPLAAISTCGAAIAGRTMARAKHYKRVAIAGTSAAAIFGAVLTVTTLPLWGLLIVLSLFALGLGTTFPVSVVSLQNSVARAQIGTVTGAMNFFRALMASFTVAAFTAILLMALGADISLAGEHRGPVSSIATADMITAFRYVFGAATALMAGAVLCMIAMEERPLAGPGNPVEMAE